jgi:hypothetical protein
MIEQLSQPTSPEQFSDNNTLEWSRLAALDISQLADLSLRGDGVALKMPDIESTIILGSVLAEKDAYMFGTGAGQGTCPVNDCVGSTNPKGDCSDDTDASSGCFK